MTLSVEELADAAGLTVRTVRFYQSEGLLPPPERAGRTVRYSASHLERLSLIGDLRGRGLRLTAIRDLVERSGGTPDEWSELRDALHRPFSDDRAALLDDAELAERLAGTPSTTRDAFEAAGLIEHRHDSRPPVWYVPSPGLLDATVATVRLGIEVETALELRSILQRRLRRLAAELVDRFAGDVAFERLAADGPAALTGLLDAIQPLAGRAVEVVFAHEIARARQRLLEEAGAS